MAHALLAPSSASRWIKCPRSARFEAQFPDTAGDAAEEGSVAHLLGELLLKFALKWVSKKKILYDIETIKIHRLYTPDMPGHCKDYRDHVLEQYSEALDEDSETEIYLEEQFDMSRWVPKGFGTGDNSIVNDYRLRINDLKYGKGVPVFAKNNAQLRMYGLGAYERFKKRFAFEKIQMTIFQPRLDSCTTEILEIRELLDWAKSVLRPAAKLAWAGKGEFNPGEHCKFCRAKGKCRALAEFNLDLLRHDFGLGDKLSEEGRLEALAKGALLVDWYNTVAKEALEEALKGRKFAGFKLVHGRSTRQYKDEEAVLYRLMKSGFLEEELVKKKIIGIGDMEKLLGKHGFVLALGDLIKKPKGAAALVRDTDARETFGSAQSDFSQFIEVE